MKGNPFVLAFSYGKLGIILKIYLLLTA